MSDFFSQVTKYTATAGRNPREDRLTEIFAAVLTRVGSLRSIVADALVGRPSPGSEVGVATQVRVHATVALTDPRIDLQLTTPTGIIWVENKHGASIGFREGGHTQVENYLAELGDRGVVVVLYPRRDHERIREEVSSEAKLVTWESLCEALRGFNSDDPVEQFLFDELWSYLNSEGLVDPEKLTDADVSALAIHRQAVDALAAVVDAASTYVDSNWADATLKSRKGLDLYDMHDCPKRAGSDQPTWPGTWWQWGVDVALDAAHQGLWVYAGLRGAEDISPRLKDGAAIDAAERLDFRLFEDRPHDRVLRIRRLEDFVHGESVTHQGTALGKWVVDAFAALSTVPAAI